MSLLFIVDPEGTACMAEEDLGLQLEDWEGSEEKQDAPAISAMEDTLLFESKNLICGVFTGTMKQSRDYVCGTSARMYLV